MEHESSILYLPVHTLWHSVQHRFAWDVPDHVIMALLVLLHMMKITREMMTMWKTIMVRLSNSRLDVHAL
jgi:hypothetical protein